MTATDTEPIAIEALDWQSPCESKLGCELPAVWVLQVSCCGTTWLLCDAHLKRWIVAERQLLARETAKCRQCGRIIERWGGFARWWLL